MMRWFGGFPFAAIFDIVATISLGAGRALFLWQTRKGGTLDICRPITTMKTSAAMTATFNNRERIISVHNIGECVFD
jgi:hypothetical protein